MCSSCASLMNGKPRVRKEMETQKAVRKPFRVDAIQVTEDNMEEVAIWCHGEIITEDGKRFIKVSVHQPLNERQTRAHVTDWVLYASKGYKVYTEKAMGRSFDFEEGSEVKNVFDNNEAHGYDGDIPPINAGVDFVSSVEG